MGQTIMPSTRPLMSRDKVLQLCGVTSLSIKNPAAGLCPVKMIFIRGYYANSFGVPATNDIGVYDDALFVDIDLPGLKTFKSFNANTDPSRYHVGVATLALGVWWYMKKKHKNTYWAFGQAAKVLVHRHKEADQRGFFGINVHRGGPRNTWSEGCLTIPEHQFDEVQQLVYKAMDLAKLDRFPLFLIAENGRPCEV